MFVNIEDCTERWDWSLVDFQIVS